MDIQGTQRLATEVLFNAISADADKTEAILNDFRAKQPFLYTLVGDTISAATNTKRGEKQIEHFKKVIEERINSLANWTQEGNQTVEAINKGQIDAEAIKPHVRQEAKAYKSFYADQSSEIAARSAAAAAFDHNEEDSLGFNFLPKKHQPFISLGTCDLTGGNRIWDQQPAFR
jgi:hypothetical protein